MLTASFRCTHTHTGPCTAARGPNVHGDVTSGGLSRSNESPLMKQRQIIRLAAGDRQPRRTLEHEPDVDTHGATSSISEDWWSTLNVAAKFPVCPGVEVKADHHLWHVKSRGWARPLVTRATMEIKKKWACIDLTANNEEYNTYRVQCAGRVNSLPSDWQRESKVRIFVLHSGSVSVCNISARKEMRKRSLAHDAWSLTQELNVCREFDHYDHINFQKSCWDRLSQPSVALVIRSSGKGRARRTPPVSTWLWMCCGINQLSTELKITMASHDEVWRRLDSRQQWIQEGETAAVLPER